MNSKCIKCKKWKSEVVWSTILETDVYIKVCKVFNKVMDVIPDKQIESCNQGENK